MPLSSVVIYCLFTITISIAFSTESEAKDCSSVPQKRPCPEDMKAEQTRLSRRYFFDSKSGTCQTFEGCSATDENLFESIVLCIVTCDWFGKGDRMLVGSMMNPLDCSHPERHREAAVDKLSERMKGIGADLSRKSDEEVVRLLVDLARDKHGWTLLHHAAHEGNVGLVRQLVEQQDASFTTTTSSDETALHLAVQKNHLAVVQILFDLAENKEELGDLIDAKDRCGYTALHLAAYGGNFEIIKILRANGADVRAENVDGKIALHLAKSASLVDYLLEDPKSSKTSRQLVNTPDHLGRTPFFYARDVVLAKRFQQFGVSARRDIFSMLPIMFAVAMNNADFVRFLLSQRSDRRWFVNNVTCCGHERNLAHVAARFNAVNALQVLLELGLELDSLVQTDGQGQSPYCIAVSHGNAEMVKFLESKGIGALDCFQTFINTVNSSLALVEAVRIQQLEAVEFLLAKTTSLTQTTQKDESGRSPLHLASMNCTPASIAIIEMILASLYADPTRFLSETDKHGATPLELAVRRNCPDIVTKLLSFSDTACTLPNKDDLTPIQLAKELEFDVLVDKMIETGSCNSDSCVPRCNLKPEVKNGVFAPGPDFQCVGGKVSITCLDGFKLLGSGSAVCLENGQWETDAFCRKESECGEVPIVDEGWVSRGLSSFGSMREVSCNSGYQLLGPDKLECNSDGKWIVRGLCEELQCRGEMDVQNGIVSEGSNFIGAERHITCNANYQLVGSDVVKCSYAKWIFGGYCKQVPVLPPPIDCEDLHKRTPALPSGVYTISPANTPSIVVYCEMTYLGGGWTVLQRRIDDSQDFFLNWDKYKQGFGNPGANFWLGNDNIHAITAGPNDYNLLISLTAFDGSSGYALYDGFRIEDEKKRYMLRLRGFKGNGNNTEVGDSLTQHKNMQFSTIDSDSDLLPNENCAKTYHGGWWYRYCHWSNLNGVYGSSEFGVGLNWYSWRGYRESMKSSAMMIRRSAP